METSEKQSSFLLGVIRFTILVVLILFATFGLIIFNNKLKTEALRFDHDVTHADRNIMERLTFDGEIDEYTRLYAASKVNDVPEKYINLLSDWNIIFTKKQISQIINENDFNLKWTTIAAADNKFSGLCSYKQKTIYINTEKHNIDQAVSHEVGHAIDKILEYPSKTDEFINIYNKEKDLVFDDEYNYYKSTNLEYWAECFELFLLDEEDLLIKGPETYEYMNNVLEKEELITTRKYQGRKF